MARLLAAAALNLAAAAAVYFRGSLTAAGALGGALLAFAGALAAANADTWASELGLLSRSDPVSILTLRPVPRGCSGAVSGPGTLASLAGSLLIAAAFAVGAGFRGLPARVVAIGFAVVAGSGFLGALLDSVCGSAVQGRFVDRGTGEYSERGRDAEGRPNPSVGGLRFVNNDVVNLLCTASGAATALVLSSLLRV